MPASAVSMPGNDRHLRVRREAARRDLIADGLHRRGGRPDENEPRLFDRARERRTLRQKSVAGMNRVGASLDGGAQNRIDIEVALGRRRRTNQPRLVGLRDMRRGSIRVGVDRHRLEAEQARAANHAQSDLASIRDQQFLERPALHAYILKTPKFPPAGIGAFNDAAIPSARAWRVSTGSSTPSSHSRALE